MNPILADIVYLTPYAPVIQLIAGVYLIFFYQTVFDKDFLEGSIQKRLKDNLTGTLRMGGEYIPEKVYSADMERFTTWWSRYTRSVIAVARMGCVYAITLLIYYGIESVDHKLGLKALLIDSLLYAIYAVVTIFIFRWKFLCNTKAWFFGCLLFSFIGYIFPPQEFTNCSDGLWGMSMRSAINLILWLSGLAIVLSFARYQIDEWHYRHTDLCVAKSTKILSEFSSIRMTITPKPLDEAMRDFYEAYGHLLDLKNWRYDESEKFKDIRTWNSHLRSYYEKRYQYWVSPIYRKIMHQIIHLPNKCTYWRTHQPCHFALILLLLLVLLFYGWLAVYY